MARNAELQFALALRDQTVAELRDEIESLRARKTTIAFDSSAPASNNPGDVDDNSSVSSFDDYEDDDEESERGSMTHKRNGSKIPNIASLFPDDGFDEDEDAWREHEHHRSVRKSTPTGASVNITESKMRESRVTSSLVSSRAPAAASSSSSSSSKQQPGSKSAPEQNANSLSARRRALAIERAALKAGNLSARGGPARSVSAIPSSSKYGDMIRDASLIFNRSKSWKRR